MERAPDAKGEMVSGTSGCKSLSKPKAIPTQVFVILRNYSLQSYAKDILRQEIHERAGQTVEFTIDGISVGKRGLKVTLTVSSIAKARKLIKSINKKCGLGTAFMCSRKDKLIRSSVYSEYESEERTYVNVLEHAVLQEIQTHKLKEKDITAKLTRSKLPSVENDENRKVLEDKLKELAGQEKEFLQKCTTLKNSVQSGRNDSTKHLTERLEYLFREECRKFRIGLPIYGYRSRILESIHHSQVCIVIGETGSGKSTQLPLYLLESGMGKARPIVCTEPRKLPAISLAKHVSNQRGMPLGSDVGYNFGRESMIKENTELIYMTDFFLLNQCLSDPDLSQYSCVIVDEAHERSIYTDLLLGMIKKCLVKRPDLKVIITSATIDPGIFMRYFGHCPVVQVPGRLYPVEVTYKNDETHPEVHYLHEAIEKAKHVHRTEGPGDILVFVATPAETEQACNILDNLGDHVVCLPLHGRLQPRDQQQIFQDLPPGKRKVIIATNVAETSVTIPGVKYVIDSGMCKEKTYNVQRNMSILEINNISRSSADQRKGRAGRTGPGKCFRLYTEEEYEGFVKNSVPEILRVHLGQALIKLIHLGVVDPLSFDFVEAPSKTAMQEALRVLQEIEAIAKETGKLTELGNKLSKIALEPRLGKLVLEGIKAGFAMEAIVIAAYTSSGSNAYYRGGSMEEKTKADAQKTTFCHEDGDFFTFLNVYKEWEKAPTETERRTWCFANSINAKTMSNVRRQVHDIRYDLKKDLGILVGMQFSEGKPNMHDQLARILLTCYPCQLCHFSGHYRAGYILSNGEECYQIHPSSALRLLGYYPKWLIYNQLLKTSQDFMINVTVVSDDTVRELQKERKITIDPTQFQHRLVFALAIKNVGSYLLHILAGPRHSTRRSLEENISGELDGKPVVVDLDFEYVTATIYTPLECHCKAEDKINNFLENQRSRLLKEKVQVPVGPQNPICTILGTGGSVEQLLMPGEFRVFHLTVPVLSYNEPFFEKFESFGEVEIFKFPTCKYQGKVHCKFTYALTQNAEEAYKYALTIKEGKAWPEKTAGPLHASSSFKLFLSWTRRPNRGVVYIKFDHEDEAKEAFYYLTGENAIETNGVSQECDIPFYGDQVLIKYVGRRGHDLMLREMNANVSNKVINEAVNNILKDKCHVDELHDTVVPRDNGILTTSVDINHYKNGLTQIIKSLSKTSEFELTMPVPSSASTVEQYAWINFKDPEAGARVLEELEYTDIGLYYLSKRVTGTLVITNDVMTVINDSLSEYQHQLCPFKQAITLKETEQGNWFINMSANTIKLYGEMKRAVDKLTSPDTIDCFDEGSFEAHLLQSSAHTILCDIEKQTGTKICKDKRYKRVTIFGKDTRRKRAIRRIAAYLQTLKPRVVENIKLGGQGCQKGLLRTFLKKYGLDLDELIDDCALQSARLDLQRRILVAVGDAVTIKNLRKIIMQLQEELKQIEGSEHTDNPKPECSVCLCPSENTYRLNCCGHPYCFVCLTYLVKIAIRNSEIPLMCSQDQCSERLYLRDIREVIGGNFELIATAAVSCFVKKSQNLVKFCPSPECSSVYRVTKIPSSFICPACFIRICTACSSPGHEGLSCRANKFNQENEKRFLQLWLCGDTKKRALCPRCSVMIEKTGGCRTMTCTNCCTIFCWTCKSRFANKRSCSNHLCQKPPSAVGSKATDRVPSVTLVAGIPKAPRAKTVPDESTEISGNVRTMTAVSSLPNLSAPGARTMGKSSIKSISTHQLQTSSSVRVSNTLSFSGTTKAKSATIEVPTQRVRDKTNSSLITHASTKSPLRTSNPAPAHEDQTLAIPYRTTIVTSQSSSSLRLLKTNATSNPKPATRLSAAASQVTTAVGRSITDTSERSRAFTHGADKVTRAINTSSGTSTIPHLTVARVTRTTSAISGILPLRPPAAGPLVRKTTDSSEISEVPSPAVTSVTKPTDFTKPISETQSLVARLTKEMSPPLKEYPAANTSVTGTVENTKTRLEVPVHKPRFSEVHGILTASETSQVSSVRAACVNREASALSRTSKVSCRAAARELGATSATYVASEVSLATFTTSLYPQTPAVNKDILTSTREYPTTAVTGAIETVITHRDAPVHTVENVTRNTTYEGSNGPPYSEKPGRYCQCRIL